MSDARGYGGGAGSRARYPETRRVAAPTALLKPMIIKSSPLIVLTSSGQTRAVSQPLHPPPSSLGSSYFDHRSPTDLLTTISRGHLGSKSFSSPDRASFKQSASSSPSPSKQGASEAVGSKLGGSTFLWILLDVLACRREDSSYHSLNDCGSEVASTAHWTAPAPPPTASLAVGDSMGSFEPLFAQGCEIQCHVKVKGVISALMPELANGISTRAVAIPLHSSLHPNSGASEDSSDEAEVQWLERFVIRLPSELCEVLLSRGPHLDPQVGHTSLFCLTLGHSFSLDPRSSLFFTFSSWALQWSSSSH